MLIGNRTLLITGLIILLTTISPFAQDLFDVRTDYPVEIEPNSVCIADFDGDGHLDLAVSNWFSNSISIVINNGDGTFASTVNYPAGGSCRGCFAVDLNGDSSPDLAVANWDSNTVSILINNGDGTLADAITYGVGTGPMSVFAADFDGDAQPDLAVVNYWSENVSVLKNNGNGTFAVAISYGVGDDPQSVFAVDLDGDGDHDLAVANGNINSNSVSILMNDGNGTFATAVDYGVGNNPWSVFAEDFDGDGDNDLAVANIVSNTISILKNNGNGTFAGKVDYGVGDYPRSVFSADFDVDGDFDLVVANTHSNSVSVLENTGNGTFLTAVDYGVGTSPWSVYAADLDGDSDYDLAVANMESDNVSILLNNHSYSYEWFASSGQLPEESCPGWALGNPGGIAPPSLIGDTLVIVTSAASEYLFYNQAAPDVAFKDFQVLETKVRYNYGGTPGHPSRDVGVIGFSVGPDSANYVYIGQDRVIIRSSDLVVGDSALVDTDDDFHVYRIEVDMIGYNVNVFYDDSLILTGSGGGESTHPFFSFGDGANTVSGSTSWLYFKHNVYAFDIDTDGDGIYDACDPDSGLVAFYSFDDGTALDNSGTGNDGTIYGANPVSGVSGQGMSFDGIDDLVEVTDSPSLDITGDITISAWMNLESMPFVASILSKGDNQENFGYYLATGTNYLGGSTSWQIANGSDVRNRLDGNQYLLTDRWYHVVAVRNGTSMSVYINGSEINSGTCFSDGLRSNDIPLKLGYYHSDYYYNGILDEVRIYNRSLDQTEILDLYSSIQVPSVCQEFTGLYCDDFEDGDEDGWVHDDMDWGTWTVDNGVINAHLDPSESISWRFTGNRDWDDVNFGFDFNTTTGVEKLVYLRWDTDGANGYLIRIKTNYGSFNQSEISVNKYVDNTPASSTIYPVVTASNTWYHVDFELIGNSISFALDGVPQFTYTDPANLYPTGIIGLGLINGFAQDCNRMLDNVEISCAVSGSCNPFAHMESIVQDQSNSNPLSDVMIDFYQGSTLRYQTNSITEGLFHQRHIDAGDYILEFSKLGYSTLSVPMTFIENHNNTIPAVNLLLLDCPSESLDWGLPINTELIGDAPSIGPNGEIIYYVVRVGSWRDILYSTWDGTTWSVSASLPIAINSSSYDEVDPTISGDGETLYFGSNRPGGQGSLDIYMSRFVSGDWENAQPMDALNSASYEQDPEISKDGSLFFFTSGRTGGYGDGDIWVSSWDGTAWAPPQNIGSSINSSANEQDPAISNNNDTLFFTRYTQSGGQLYYSVRDNGTWCPAIASELGFPGESISSPAIDPAKSRLYFVAGEIHYCSMTGDNNLQSSAPLVAALDEFSSAYYEYMNMMANGVETAIDLHLTTMESEDHSYSKALANEIYSEWDNATIDATVDGLTAMLDQWNMNGFLPSQGLKSGLTGAGISLAEFLVINAKDAYIQESYDEIMTYLTAGSPVGPNFKDESFIVFWGDDSPIPGQQAVSITDLLGAIDINKSVSIPEYLPADFPMRQLISDLEIATTVTQKATILDVDNPPMYWVDVTQSIPGFCDISPYTQYGYGLLNHRMHVLKNQYNDFMGADQASRKLQGWSDKIGNTKTAYKLYSLKNGPNAFPRLSGAIYAQAALLGFETGRFISDVITVSAEADLAIALSELTMFWPDYFAETFRFFNAFTDPILSATQDLSLLSCTKVPVQVTLSGIPEEVCVPFLEPYVMVNGQVSITNLDTEKPTKFVVYGYVYAGTEISKTPISPIRTDIIDLAANQSLDIPISFAVPSPVFPSMPFQYTLELEVISSGQKIPVPKHGIKVSLGPSCQARAPFRNTSNLIFENINEGETIQTTITASPSSKGMEFSMRFGGSDVDLHVFDQSNNHVGREYVAGVIELEIAGAELIGDSTTTENIYIPTVPGEIYTVSAIGIDLPDSETVTVDVIEILEADSDLILFPDEITMTCVAGDTTSFKGYMWDRSGQNSIFITGISVSSFVDSSSNQLPQSGLSLTYPNSVPADTSVAIILTVSIPDDQPVGDYNGGLTFSYGSDSVIVATRIIVYQQFCICGEFTAGQTGNTNCDTEGLRNLSDITRLIDNVYISKAVLCCPDNGNINGDVDDLLNLADITMLIDHVYITKSATAACE